jgi:hypothetical protein
MATIASLLEERVTLQVNSVDRISRLTCSESRLEMVATAVPPAPETSQAPTSGPKRAQSLAL